MMDATVTQYCGQNIQIINHLKENVQTVSTFLEIVTVVFCIQNVTLEESKKKKIIMKKSSICASMQMQ